MIAKGIPLALCSNSQYTVTIILVSKGSIKKIVQIVQQVHLNAGKVTFFDRKHADLDLLCNVTIRDAVYTTAN